MCRFYWHPCDPLAKHQIICVEKKVSQRDIIRFGVNTLKKYFNVDIVNFSDLINKKKSKHTSKQKNIRDIDSFLKAYLMSNGQEENSNEL